MTDPWQMKRCRHCGEWKLLEEFWRDSGCADGRSQWCTQCRQVTRDNIRFVSVTRDGRDILDLLPSTQEEADPTYEQVVTWLWRNVDGRVINEHQMGAILLHAVDLIPFEAIGELAGLHHSTVIHHYQRGIEAMRRRYA